MSLFKSIFPTVPALITLILLSGCANIGQYSDAVYDELGRVAISTEKSRASQLYRQEFERLTARHGILSPQYRLEVDITSMRGEYDMVMVSAFRLYDVKTGEEITKNSFSSSASIGGVSSLFGEDQATIHAAERLSLNLAQKTYHHLIVFFNRRHLNP